VTLPTSGERIVCARNKAHDRFEGEYPRLTWPRGRDAQALLTGYAPSKYRTKPWPSEALLEVWYSLSREVPAGFMLDVPLLDQRNDPQLSPPQLYQPAPRDWLSRSAVAVNANEPPGVEGEEVGDQDGSALDAAFPRSEPSGGSSL
jgi:hypothetical protein